MPPVSSCPHSRIVCLVLLCWLPLWVQAASSDPVELFNSDYYSVTDRVHVLHDPADSLSIEDVIAADQAGKFAANERSSLNFGFLDYPVWVRFDAVFPDSYLNAKARGEWYLEVGSPLLDVGILYQVDQDGLITERRSDISMKFSEREVNHVFSVFPVKMSPGETQRFYVKMQTAGSFYVPIKFWQPGAYAQKVATEEFLYGMFYGSMLCIVVFNLLIYLSVRDVGYLYYIAYLAGITLLFFIDLGHGVNLLESGGELFHKSSLGLVIWLNWIAVCQFLRSFLETRHYPLIDQFFARITTISFIYMFVDLYMPYKVSISWASSATLVLFAAFAPICIHIWRKGNVNALYFLVAWAFNMFGLSVYALMALGYIPSTTLLVSLAPLGILSEAVLLSFALAERVKRAQKSMEQADQRAMDHLSRYQSVFNNALEGIYQLSLDGRFMRVNPSMARHLGFKDLQELALAGTTAVGYCYNNPKSQYGRLLKEKSLKEEINYQKHDGTLAWADHSAQLIVDEDGEASHIEGTFIDITERKRREEAERLREQERAGKETAKIMAAAKTEFLASMSHQIRTPLTSIIGYSEAIKSLQLSGSEREDAIKTIAHSSQQLLKLINEILDYSKIEAGKFELERLPVKVQELLAKVQHRYGWQATQKDLVLSMEYLTEFPDTIVSDPVRLETILESLVGNAVKYTKQGYVKVLLSWLPEESAVALRVADSGIGMSELELARLFDVFSLHDESRARQYGGSRLGMAIAKELACLLGGDLTVTSTPGVGTEFTLKIKTNVTDDCSWMSPGRVMVEIEDSAARADTPSNPAKAIMPRLEGRVLLAEDNKVNQTLISKIISKTGAKVTVAENGKLAVAEALAAHYDVILMDINMPEMDGLEATRELRRQGVKAPVFALTAETDEKELASALGSGCLGCLSKPVNKSHLYEVLSAYLQVLSTD